MTTPIGHLRTETGVHRLVRKSPFDSAGGRHTSFASLFVYPGSRRHDRDRHQSQSDVRTDTFRASPVPAASTSTRPIRRCGSRTFPPASSCSARTAAASTATATSPGSGCAARLYDFEMRKQLEAQQKLEDTKTDVGWGHQIRSYVLDQSRIKDLRTNVEISNTQKVLDGDLDPFIEASLKQGL